jgi:predicted outer membrane repeat protein
VDGSGKLHAGGLFTTAGGVSANYVAQWDGTSWEALGSGMDRRVLALAVDGGGKLYAGGDFTTAGGVSANYVARWDGTNWSALGSGMNSSVYALAVDGSGNVEVGGWFTSAGSKPSSYFGIWHPPSPPTAVVVYPDGSGTYPTIQAAIDAVAVGGTVLLADGILTGPGNRDLDFHGKALTVRSQSNDPNASIIDCQGSESDPHRGFYFHSGEGAASVLEAVSVINGYGLWNSVTVGGAIVCEGTRAPSSPTIRRCIFRENHGSYGGAIYLLHSSPVITECTFIANGASTRGGAIWAEECVLDITSSTFYANSAPVHGSVLGSETSTVTMSHCILTDSPSGWPVNCIEEGTVELSCCDVHGNAGGDWIDCLEGQDSLRNNLWTDPLFCSTELGDLRLRSESACAPENNPACGLIGSMPAGDCPLMPDLVVPWCEPDTVVSGQPVTMVVTVKNRGTADVAATKTRVTVDGEVKCDQIDTPAMEAGASVDVDCAFGAIPIGAHEVQIRADATGLVSELLELNNLLTQPLVVLDASGVTEEHVQKWETALLGVIPNPFSGTTTIRYSLAAGSVARLEIFDAAGRQVRLLHGGFSKAGAQTVIWDGRNGEGASVGSGVYYLHFGAGGRTWSRPIVLIR